jgi:hypothetical protein
MILALEGSSANSMGDEVPGSGGNRRLATLPSWRSDRRAAAEKLRDLVLGRGSRKYLADDFEFVARNSGFVEEEP